MSSSQETDSIKTVKTVCHRDCPSTCFIDAKIENGKLIATKGSNENPVTKGILCPRGMGDPKRVYSKDRVLNPHIKTEKGYKQVSWETALKLTASKLKQTLDEHGRESVLLYDYPGNQGFLTWQYSNRLWQAMGATITDGVISLSVDCKIGDKVKLIYPGNKEEIVKVVEVNKDSIKVDSTKAGDVIVYGKEVDDYKTVDYDALSMLNISATQELYKIIKELKEELRLIKAV